MAAPHPELFTGLSEDQTSALLALGAPVHLGAGDPLFRLGDSADAVYLIRRGRIALTLPIEVGGRAQDVLIEEHVPGQTLGWSALIPPHKFTLNAVAPLDTELSAFHRVDLLRHFEAHPDVGRIVSLNVARVIGQRLHVFQAMWLREMQRIVRHVHA
jgi:CRP/FNR family cyclic AMP-dependent transcriptional regulator